MIFRIIWVQQYWWGKNYDAILLEKILLLEENNWRKMNTPLSDFSFERVGPGGQAMIFPIPLGKEFVNEIFFGVDFFIYTNQFTVLIEHSPVSHRFFFHFKHNPTIILKQF